MVNCFECCELDGYFRQNRGIHGAIVLAARNLTLAAPCQALSARVQCASYLSNMSDDLWSAAMVAHEEIIHLLEERDGQRLGRVPAVHIMATQDAILLWPQREAPTRRK